LIAKHLKRWSDYNSFVGTYIAESGQQLGSLVVTMLEGGDFSLDVIRVPPLNVAARQAQAPAKTPVSLLFSNISSGLQKSPCLNSVSHLTISVWPLLAATCSGISPASLAMLTLQPYAHRVWATD